MIPIPIDPMFYVKAFACLLAVLTPIAAYLIGHSKGENAGEGKVQALWDAERLAAVKRAADKAGDVAVQFNSNSSQLEFNLHMIDVQGDNVKKEIEHEKVANPLPADCAVSDRVFNSTLSLYDPDSPTPPR